MLAEKIWERLGQAKTLQTIAKPFAYFTPVDDMTVWKEGLVYRLRFRVFGIIPLEGY